jgi:hypothetical protein
MGQSYHRATRQVFCRCIPGFGSLSIVDLGLYFWLNHPQACVTISLGLLLISRT